MPSPRVHFPSSQDSGSHYPPEEFQKKEEVCFPEIIPIDFPGHLNKANLPKVILEVKKADEAFRNKMSFEMMAYYHNRAAYLYGKHEALYQQLKQIKISEKIDRTAWDMAVTDVNHSLKATALVDRAFVHALRISKTSQERSELITVRGKEEIAEEEAVHKLLEKKPIQRMSAK